MSPAGHTTPQTTAATVQVLGWQGSQAWKGEGGVAGLALFLTAGCHLSHTCATTLLMSLMWVPDTWRQHEHIHPHTTVALVHTVPGLHLHTTLPLQVCHCSVVTSHEEVKPGSPGIPGAARHEGWLARLPWMQWPQGSSWSQRSQGVRQVWVHPRHVWNLPLEVRTVGV